MEDLETRFRQSYWAVVHSMDTLRMRAWEDHGLTLPQLRILFLLRGHPAATTNALARHLGLTVPTVSGLVDKLVRSGLVQRGEREHDRRVVPLALTEEGATLTGEIRGQSRAYLSALGEALGGELASVVAALEQLAAAMDQVGPSAPYQEIRPGL